MNVRARYAAAVVLLVIACEGGKQLTGPGSPNDPSKVILDGNHGGNKDFFFLPPMVPLPIRNPDFELGKFNNQLRSSLRIEICELNADHLKTGGLPSDQTTCGLVKKTFAPGSVQLVDLPLKQNGWWSLLNLPPDGFYYALWDTRQSNLSVNKYYRIKVFVDGKPDPLGVADVDPMANLFQWKYTLTGEVIQLVDDVMLPITFRVERGALCEGGACNSVTITNNSPTGVQNITVEGGGGSIAGASFPNGWLPPGGPQSVVVTISEVGTSGGGNASGDATVCHVGLALQQFRGCFNYTTTPALQPINERGDEFALPVTVAVCYELDGTGDPREKFAELWASGPNERPHPLDDATDAGLLGATSRNCSRPPVIGQLNSNPVMQLASASWQKVKAGLSRAFGVKTAYAVDLGLGGFAFAFSHVSPVLSARIQPYTSTSTTLGAGSTTTATARIVGNNHHSSHALATGLGGLPVTYTLAEGNGSLLALGSEGTGSNAVTVTTNTNPIDGSPTSGGGFAPVNWTMPTPTAPGTYTYTLTATGPALGGPVTFTSTVTVQAPVALPDLVVSSGPPAITPAVLSSTGGLITLPITVFKNQGGGFTVQGGTHFGFYVSSDASIDPAQDALIGSANLPVEALETGDSVVVRFLAGQVPALTPGVYYIGVVINDNGGVPESNRGNNTVVRPFVVAGPDETGLRWGLTERRMLSMQTGADYVMHITTQGGSVWNYDDPAKLTITNTGDPEVAHVVAILGGENIAGGADANISTLIRDPATGENMAGPSALVNSFLFDIFPRTTTLAWRPIEGAVSYRVVVEFGNGTNQGCSIPSSCTRWDETPLGSTYTTALTHTFGFVGGQPGRWRVMGLDATGNVVTPNGISPYVYFAYTR